MFTGKLQAHRGDSHDFPENTMLAFREAVREGYDIIEFDPKITRDGVAVVLHDRTLDRTGRIAGGSIAGETEISKLDYRDLKDVDVGMWKHPRFAGIHIPTLSQALDYMKSVRIEAKIDNVIETFSEAGRAAVYDAVSRHGDASLTGFTFTRFDLMEEVAARFPQAPLHYDGAVTPEALAALKSVASGHKTYVWMRFDNELTSWNKNSPVNIEFAQMIKRDFLLGVWILDSDEQLEKVRRFLPDVVETTGAVKPRAGRAGA